MKNAQSFATTESGKPKKCGWVRPS